MWDYTDKVMDHFLHPRNVGIIDDADGKGDVGSLACGDALTLTFKLDENGRIINAKFKTFGCASAVASSSVLTEIIKGMTLEEAANVTNRDIAEKLGGLPDQKMHCSVMGQEALEAAIQNYYDKTKTTAPEKEGKVVCTCFGITDTEIRKVVEDNSLNSVEQVTNYCKAGGGCGRCKGDIEKIISEIRGDWVDRAKKEETPRPRKKLTNIQKIRLVQETISDQIRPALRADGGDIDLVDVEGSKVIVAFRGMCAKMADLTMRDVVQAKLREFVSEDLVVEEEKSDGK